MSEVKCPRCAVVLVEQGPMRVCRQCNGHWLDIDKLHDMAAEMRGAERPAKLPFDADPRPRIACPACGVDMDPWKVHGVPIDRCVKHGVWFDRDELQRVLQGVASSPRRAGESVSSTSGGGADFLGLVIDVLSEMF